MVDYIGSKSTILDWLFSIIESHVSLNGARFIDGCSGTGTVSIEAAKRGANVLSVDVLNFSAALLYGKSSHIYEKDLPYLSKTLNDLNSIAPIEGFIYKNYSEIGNRLYFTPENAGKIDAIRSELESLPLKYKNYFLYVLLEAISRVSNTAGTHGAFLKKFKASALSKIELKLEPYSPLGITPVVGDLLDIITSTKYNEDVLYIDPPYTKRQYAPNYHLYETITLADSPIIHGKTGLRDWKHLKSPFCSLKLIRDYIKNILITTAASNIFFSYSSDGLLPLDVFLELIEESINCEIVVEKKPYRRYKADSFREYSSTELYEYLICIKKI